MCAALATFSEGFARHRRDGYVDENALLALGLRDYAQQNRNWLKYIIRLPYVVLEWIWLLPFALGYAVVSLLFLSRGIPGWLLRLHWSIDRFINYFGNHSFEYRRARKKAADLLRLLLATRILQDGGVHFENEYVRNYIDAKKRLISKSDYFIRISRANWELLHPSYKEEVKIVTGLMDKPLQLMQLLGKQDPYVASECLLSGVQVDNGVRRLIIERATQLMMDVRGIDDEYLGSRLSLKCAQVLGQLGDTVILPSVLTLFKEHHYDSQRIFNRALIDIVITFGSDAIEPLLAHLETCPTHQLCAVASALGSVGDRSVWKPLEDTLKTATDRRTRIWLIAALANLGHKFSRDKIRRYLIREEPERYEEGIQCESWRAFAETTARRSVIDELLGLLPGDKPSLGHCFVLVIDEYIGANALQPILKCYEPSKDLELKAILAEALGIISNAEAVPVLLEDLQSIEYSGQVDDRQERWLTQVINALGKLKAIEAVDSIGCYLESESWYVFKAAVDALANIADSRAVGYLSQFLDNDFDHLYDPTGYKFVPKVGRYEAKEDVALTLISDLGTKEAMDAATSYYIQKLEVLMPESDEWRITEIQLNIIGTKRARAAIQRIKKQKIDDESNAKEN